MAARASGSKCEQVSYLYLEIEGRVEYPCSHGSYLPVRENPVKVGTGIIRLSSKLMKRLKLIFFIKKQNQAQGNHKFTHAGG